MSLRVEPGRHGRLAEFGLVVMGWWRERDIELSGSFESWAAAEEFLLQVRRAGVIAWVARAETHTRAEVTHGEEIVDKRIYVVMVKEEVHLVRAGNPAQAIRHVAKGLISAHVAKQDDMLKHRAVEVEDAGEEA